MCVHSQRSGAQRSTTSVGMSVHHKSTFVSHSLGGVPFVSDMFPLPWSLRVALVQCVSRELLWTSLVARLSCLPPRSAAVPAVRPHGGHQLGRGLLPVRFSTDLAFAEAGGRLKEGLVDNDIAPCVCFRQGRRF